MWRAACKDTRRIIHPSLRISPHEQGGDPAKKKEPNMDSGALIENWTAVCNKVKTYEGIDASPDQRVFLAPRTPGHERGVLDAHRRQRFHKNLDRATLRRGHQARARGHVRAALHRDHRSRHDAARGDASRSGRTRQPGRAVRAAQIPAGAQDPSQFRQPYEAAPANPYYQQGSPSGASTPQATMPQANPAAGGCRTSRTPYPQAPPRTRKPGRNGKVTAGPRLATRPRSRSPHNPTSTAARPNSCKTPHPMQNASSSGFDFGGVLSGSPAAPRPIDRRKPDEPTARFRKRRGGKTRGSSILTA